MVLSQYPGESNVLCHTEGGVLCLSSTKYHVWLVLREYYA